MTLLYFILAISLLVVVHEFGHFWVARRCGVKVLRFSVGFGKPFYSWTDKHGTEFALAPFPLGGYVKMLDEREGEVAEHLLDQAFTRKPPWQRIAIAAAGPVANFVFAIVAYWLLFVSGVSGVAPVIGDVQENSPAAVVGIQDGDEILSVGDIPTHTWKEVSWQLLSYLGEDADIPLTLLTKSGEQRQLELTVTRWLADADTPNPVSGLGLSPRMPYIPAVIGEVITDGRAFHAGLQPGDRILAIDGRKVDDWQDWVDRVRASPEQPLQLLIQRGEEQRQLALVPALKEGEENVGFVGAGVTLPELPESWLRTTQVGWLQALILGVEKTWQLSLFTLDSLWKMLSGDLSIKNLSGPITIAKVAGSSASGGLESFVGFLALLSVSLGVLNLLPVPVLDGGHIVLYSIEWLMGKPLPEPLQLAAVKVGMALLFSFMLVAFYNDINRL